MTFDRDILGLVANGASIATAVIAALAFFQFHWIRRSRRRRTEKLLKLGARSRRQPWRTVRGLSIELGIGENEIIDASHRSRKIARLPVNDEAGMAIGMLLAWDSPESRKAAEEAVSVMCMPSGAQESAFFTERYQTTSGGGFSRVE